MKKIIGQFLYYLTKPFILLFRFLFYKLFLKIYYLFFKIKKYELKEKGIISVFSQKAIHGIAIFLVFSVLLFSFTANTQANFSENMATSIMANAVISDFDKLEKEDLIIETAKDFNFEQNSQVIKYFDDLALNRPLNYLGDEEVQSQIIVDRRAELALVSLRQVSYEEEKVVEVERPAQTRTEIIEYEVQSGDTVSAIAQRFGLRVNTILWANNLSSFSLIRPGNKLTILPTDGILHTVRSGDTLSRLAQTYNVESNKISSYNNIAGDILTINQKIIIPGGVRISTPVRTASTPTATTPPAPAPAASPTPVATSGKMFWPTEGHRITQYYSWRHNGLDIANRTGTPIYAAEAGTVELSGWNTGYGNNIVINHGNGIKTRYAHMSQLYVRVGDSVQRGETIAAMGSTGWSTGPHLHFEVVVNGVRQNPLNYLR